VANTIPSLACCLLALAVLDVSSAYAIEGPASAVSAPAAEKVDPVKGPVAKPVVAGAAKADEPPQTEVQASVRKYCVNIAAAATDARFSWQSKKLVEVETRIKARIADLDAKQLELKAWLNRRDAIAKEAKETLVGIYAKMRPETAAAQIGALDDEMAAAVLAALTPRQASAIFNEITPPERAAKLAGLLASPAASSNDKKL
jgi:flagellar motility protein MotE (MotC chaperone)